MDVVDVIAVRGAQHGANGQPDAGRCMDQTESGAHGDPRIGARRDLAPKDRRTHGGHGECQPGEARESAVSLEWRVGVDQAGGKRLADAAALAHRACRSPLHDQTHRCEAARAGPTGLKGQDRLVWATRVTAKGGGCGARYAPDRAYFTVHFFVYE